MDKFYNMFSSSNTTTRPFTTVAPMTTYYPTQPTFNQYQQPMYQNNLSKVQMMPYQTSPMYPKYPIRQMYNQAQMYPTQMSVAPMYNQYSQFSQYGDYDYNQYGYDCPRPRPRPQPCPPAPICPPCPPCPPNYPCPGNDDFEREIEQNPELNDMIDQVIASIPPGLCGVRPPRHHREVIRGRSNCPPRVATIRRRLPSPEGDTVERLIIMEQPQDLINILIEKPTMPQPSYHDKREHAPPMPPMVQRSIVCVRPRHDNNNNGNGNGDDSSDDDDSDDVCPPCPPCHPCRPSSTYPITSLPKYSGYTTPNTGMRMQNNFQMTSEYIPPLEWRNKQIQMRSTGHAAAVSPSTSGTSSSKRRVKSSRATPVQTVQNDYNYNVDVERLYGETTCTRHKHNKLKTTGSNWPQTTGYSEVVRSGSRSLSPPRTRAIHHSSSSRKYKNSELF